MKLQVDEFSDELKKKIIKAFKEMNETRKDLIDLLNNDIENKIASKNIQINPKIMDFINLNKKVVLWIDDKISSKKNLLDTHLLIIEIVDARDQIENYNLTLEEKRKSNKLSIKYFEEEIKKTLKKEEEMCDSMIGIQSFEQSLGASLFHIDLLKKYPNLTLKDIYNVQRCRGERLRKEEEDENGRK